MTILEGVLAAVLSAILSSASTAWIANGKLNHKVQQIELKVAEKYVSKEDLNVSFTKFEEHLIRIETKFDQLLLNTRNGRET